jgi:excisionase family DNA binding protein
MSPTHLIMNAKEVSEWLRIPKSTLYKLCKDGGIPSAKVGKHWRFEKNMIDAWFEEKVRSTIVASPRSEG